MAFARRSLLASRPADYRRVLSKLTPEDHTDLENRLRAECDVRRLWEVVRPTWPTNAGPQYSLWVHHEDRVPREFYYQPRSAILNLEERIGIEARLLFLAVASGDAGAAAHVQQVIASDARWLMYQHFEKSPHAGKLWFDGFDNELSFEARSPREIRIEAFVSCAASQGYPDFYSNEPFRADLWLSEEDRVLTSYTVRFGRQQWLSAKVPGWGSPCRMLEGGETPLMADPPEAGRDAPFVWAYEFTKTICDHPVRIATAKSSTC